MIDSGRQYHHRTSYERGRLDGHFLDWANQPDVYKGYPGEVGLVDLHREVRGPEGRLSDVLKRTPGEIPPLTLELLSSVLGTAYTLTARTRHSDGEFFFRSVPSAGALYPFELYLAAGSVEGLEDGLYHFSIARHGLSRLRRIGPVKEDASPHLVFFMTAIFFRSAWKYRDRAYRYHLMDTGHLVENLVLTLRAFGLPCRLSYDFEDKRANAFLGVDPRREVCLAVLQVADPAMGPFRFPDHAEALPEAIQAASRVSSREIDYPLPAEMHACSAHAAHTPVGVPAAAQGLGPAPEEWRPLPNADHWPERLDFAEAAARRRSLRNFVPRVLEWDRFAALLSVLCLDGQSGGVERMRDHCVCPGLLAGNVEGVDPGFYLVDPAAASWGAAARGALIEPMMRVCLDQEWLSHCALQMVMIANLDLLEEAWGPRGYRYAMLTAGRLGERVYLAATAMGLGCCGIGAFYDREAAKLLGLNQSSRMLYLLGVGPVKKLPHDS
ncbi:SagB-type dehydrogenase domain protein [uncultured Desulfatiglans sp.]|nr:SagB-type dehydrogenase domain protein [uncultured Desulfatiglans sp.]